MQGSTYGTGIPGAAPPPKKGGALKWVLIAIGVVLVLGVGSCIAFVATVGNEVNKAIESATSLPTSLPTDLGDTGDGGDTTDPGTSDQSADAIEITEGKGFEVRNLSYADGWTITTTPLGMGIDNLEVTNNGDSQDYALVDVRLWKGDTVLGSINCASEPVDPGATVTMVCISGDDKPSDYDRITIQDMF